MMHIILVSGKEHISFKEDKAKDVIAYQSVAQKVGARVKAILSDREITQEKFSDMMYVDPRTVRRWLNEGIDSLNSISAIAEALGMPLKEILIF